MPHSRRLRHLLFPFVGLTLLTCGAAAMAGGTGYTLDPDASFASFEVLHFGTSTLRGRFGPLTGRVELDPDAGRGAVGVEIPTAQVDTGVKPLDARLRAADLFDSAAFPSAWFVARGFRFVGGQPVEVRGEFTLRGISQGLTLRALHFACRDDSERHRQVCGGDFEGTLKRSDFGMGFGLPFVADRVRLVIQVEAVRD